jgi:hypothetical protein
LPPKTINRGAIPNANFPCNSVVKRLDKTVTRSTNRRSLAPDPENYAHVLIVIQPNPGRGSPIAFRRDQPGREMVF